MRDMTFKYESCPELNNMTKSAIQPSKGALRYEVEELCHTTETMMEGIQRAINAIDALDEFITDEGVSSYALLQELEDILKNPPLASWKGKNP